MFDTIGGEISVSTGFGALVRQYGTYPLNLGDYYDEVMEEKP
jgi:hypothetical protein